MSGQFFEVFADCTFNFACHDKVRGTNVLFQHDDGRFRVEWIALRELESLSAGDMVFMDGESGWMVKEIGR